MKALGIGLLSLLLFTTSKAQVAKNHGLIGKWKLVESFADPGDGSGKWEPAKTAFIIEIRSDSSVRVTGAGASAFGNDSTFVLKSLERDKLKFKSKSRTSSVNVQRYKLTETSLELIYFCIEGCGHRFQAIK